MKSIYYYPMASATLFVKFARSFEMFYIKTYIMVELRKEKTLLSWNHHAALSHISSTTKYPDKIPKFPDKHITIKSTEMGFETY